MNDVVVVGAGPAGMRCAERLAAAGAAVTLIGAEPGSPYDRVALSQYLAGDIDPATLVSHTPAALAELGVRHRPGVRVTAIDRATRTLALEGGERLGYRQLVLALGAAAIRLPLPGAGLPGVLMYRTLADVEAMLALAAGGGTVVVIGGGLLGLEAAVGLARRGLAVTVLHAMDTLMERQLDAAASAMLVRRLRQLGVAVVLGAASVAIEGGNQVEAVRLADSRQISCRAVVMAVGIRPEAALAKAAGLMVGRGIVVDAAMRTSDEAIWAVGECAEHAGQCVGLVAPARAQAEIAAGAILGGATLYQAAALGTALKVAGVGVWSGGDIGAQAGAAIVLEDAQNGQYRRLVLNGGRLVGALLYGQIQDAGWYMGLIASGRDCTARRATLAFGPRFGPELAA